MAWHLVKCRDNFSFLYSGICLDGPRNPNGRSRF